MQPLPPHGLAGPPHALGGQGENDPNELLLHVCSGRWGRQGRVGGQAGVWLGTLHGQGIKLPSSGYRENWCLEHGPGCRSLPKHGPEPPGTGSGPKTTWHGVQTPDRCIQKAESATAKEKQGLYLQSPNPWGHPEVPSLINCPAPCDEFVQSRFRKKGDEIKSCNYLLKLQPLSRRTELLQTPLAGSLCMGERE